MKHLALLILLPILGCSTVTPSVNNAVAVATTDPAADSRSQVVLSKAAIAAMKQRSGQILSVVWYGECGDRPVGISCEKELPAGEEISRDGIRIVADSDVMEHLDDLGPLVIDYDFGRFSVNLSKPLPSADPAECEECRKKMAAKAKPRLILSDAVRKAMKLEPGKFWSVTYNGTCNGMPALGFYPEVQPLDGGVDISQDGFRIFAESDVIEHLDKMGPIVIDCTPAGKDYVFTAEFKNATKVDDCPECNLKERNR